ncbi:BgTH12-02265 [Blumeria graminis f. sp. triticale]|uniref:BgTH12-02265 n=1 Tax=Blumeria graminis f. sp. triticale TaxID=1689686 RepID=A0A9W4D501_BLUGR|nr:BgTH12-02265 [Blumeria graminis f. sp. triticale]
MQHHPHHPPQQGPPPHHLQQPRPSSIVHQQHHQQQAPPTQPQHSNPYPSHSGLPQYTQGTSAPSGQLNQDAPYYQSHPSPYSTPASGTYSSTETPEIMAAAQMGSRPYPPISYHTPQSNSPASVASSSGHDQHRMYGAPPSQLQQNAQMYYAPPPQQYPPMPPQGPQSYAPHPQQHHQSMTSQPNLLLTHAPPQHQMQQHPNQHSQQGMTGSPRPKIEPHVPQITRTAPPQQQPPQSQQSTPQSHPNSTAPMNQNNAQNGPGGPGVNPNAAPGPIPATTPLVVRQDNNGVQWIAFEYSRDRVKMEYTIRCDVESINVETLTPEFKTENCVYPRACCSKDQYRGNRLVYETECNTVGWALAELNPCLRGKRGLIQRAVDSWRNSNQDPRLRSRRVRRMAKISNRKAVQSTTHPPPMAGPSGPTGIPPTGNMGPGGAGSMGKPTLGGMGGPQLHHHHNHPDGGAPGGEDVGENEYLEHNQGQQQSRLHQAAEQDDARQAHVFSEYNNSPYPSNPSVGGPSMTPHLNPHPIHSTPSHASMQSRIAEELNEEERLKLFGDIPESKKRKFILVDDPGKGGRVRVRVTLDTVDIKEIPDSFRKSNSVYPRSWFPLQMQSPPPSAHGSRFFEHDEDDLVEVEGRGMRHGRTKMRVSVPLGDGGEAEIGVPRMRKSMRRKEVRLNDLGYRMTWHQSRVFADKTVFLQKALDSYRNKVRTTMESIGKDVPSIAPHFETRVGKRRWNERNKRERRTPVDG